jgi:leucyl aminopeptidase
LTVNNQLLSEADAAGARPIWLVGEQGLAGWLELQTPAVRSWLKAQGFNGERQKLVLVPTSGGDGIAGAVLGLGPVADLAEPTLWTSAGLPDRLPPGKYRFAGSFSAVGATQITLGWQYGSYRFTRYRKPAGELPALVSPAGADLEYVRLASEALAEARDLINTPANDLGPAELGEAVQRLALQHEAECRILVGEELLRQNYPLIYEVGKGSAREPRLIDMRWGQRNAPLVTLVGKGVCFDTGGLDIKPSSGMILMKKDMGGAALVLALARMLMGADAPIQLRLLIPAVENSISGRSYRPSDVLRSRQGLTVEIGNTDAEGRLVLADALAAADQDEPALLVDLATLTGAARVALGPELPAIYSQPAELAEQLRLAGEREADPMWPMPLWPGYDEDLSSRVADLNNVSATPFAGSIIGALFLKRFVTRTRNWLHGDVYAWNARERPGRPVGGDPHTVRALYSLIRQRFG